MTHLTNFILNEHLIETDYPTGMLVLDFLRRQLWQTGTKEGCKEGDCGACVVLVGSLLEDDTVQYKPVTSCLLPLGELEGMHLVTIEGLNMNELSPVQQAVVEEGGTQCGFCTPGIVVSMNALLMDSSKTVDLEGIKYALSGHLCRCTGYHSLKNTAALLSERLGPHLSADDRLSSLVAVGALPNYFLEIPSMLRDLAPEPVEASNENGFDGTDLLIAGGTDLYVQVGEKIPDTNVKILNRLPGMKGIRRVNGHYEVGALTTFEEFRDNPEMQELMPDLGHFMYLIASWQVRNRATLSGNIINASPIGDMTALLLVLESELVLRDGKKERVVPLKEFYKGYKQMDRKKSEILTTIWFPAPVSGTKINFEKVSKRTCLDIASVNSGMLLQVEDGVVKNIQFSLGGVAPIPLFLGQTCQFLEGRAINMENARRAIEMTQEEIAPIDDVRGKADYKRRLAKQLFIGHLTKLCPQKFKVKDFYEL